MSTVFDLPCPGCGHHMSVRKDGDAECVACNRRYHARMGHLFPVVEAPDPLTGAREPVDRVPS